MGPLQYRSDDGRGPDRMAGAYRQQSGVREDRLPRRRRALRRDPRYDAGFAGGRMSSPEFDRKRAEAFGDIENDVYELARMAKVTAMVFDEYVRQRDAGKDHEGISIKRH